MTESTRVPNLPSIGKRRRVSRITYTWQRKLVEMPDARQTMRVIPVR
jgi:hypothetical protein